MSDLYGLTENQMARLEPYFLKSHGTPRVDDRWVLSGIVFVNRNGLRWLMHPGSKDRPRRSTTARSGGAKGACSCA